MAAKRWDIIHQGTVDSTGLYPLSSSFHGLFQFCASSVQFCETLKQMVPAKEIVLTPEILSVSMGRFMASVEWLQGLTEDHASSIP